jgi:hypothetical protein
MFVQILVNDAQHSVDLQEEKFESGDVLVKESSHLKLIGNTLQSTECNFFRLENCQQESSHVIHTLAVFNLRIVISVRFQYVCQSFHIEIWH